MPLSFCVCHEEAGARMELPAVATSPVSYPGVAVWAQHLGLIFQKPPVHGLCAVLALAMLNL